MVEVLDQIAEMEMHVGGMDQNWFVETVIDIYIEVVLVWRVVFVLVVAEVRNMFSLVVLQPDAHNL